MKSNKILNIALATLLTGAPVVVTTVPQVMHVYAQETQTADPVVKLAVRKLAYGSAVGLGAAPELTNNGEEIQLPATVKTWDKSIHGDVGFTVYKLDKNELKKTTKNGPVIAQEVQDALEAGQPLPYGATVYKSQVTVDDQGVALFEGVENNTDATYVIIETQKSAMVKTPSKPMLVQLPITASSGRGYLSDTISLYPKNEAQELSFNLTKFVQRKADAQKKVIGNIDFKLYAGELGSGKVIKETEDTDKIYTTDNQGNLTVEGLVKGHYYFVEQGKTGLVDDALTENEDKTADLMVRDIAQNTAQNKLGFTVNADGSITPDYPDVYNNYINYDKPDIDKSITNPTATVETDKSSYNENDDINFKVAISVPYDITGYSVFEFTDQLEIDNAKTDLMRYVGEPVLATKEGVALVKGEDYTYTLDPAGNAFLINFVVNGKVTDKVAATREVVINYKAEFHGTDLVPNGDYSNKVELRYNNGQHTNKDRFDDDEVEMTTYGFKAKKINDGLWGSGITPEALAGAEFILSKDVDGQTLYYTGNNANESLFSTNKDDAKVFVTDDQGLLSVTGLQAGTYTLTETKAPAGYRLPLNPTTTIEVGAASSTTTPIAEIKNDRTPDLVVTGTEQMVITAGVLVVTMTVGAVFVLKNRKSKES